MMNPITGPYRADIMITLKRRKFIDRRREGEKSAEVELPLNMVDRAISRGLLMFDVNK